MEKQSLINYYTEGNAIQKHCPFAIYHENGNPDERLCVASKCMMWIWKTTADGHLAMKMVSETGDVEQDFKPVGRCGRTILPL